jgi:hypothetical protein
MIEIMSWILFQKKANLLLKTNYLKKEVKSLKKIFDFTLCKIGKNNIGKKELSKEYNNIL